MFKHSLSISFRHLGANGLLVSGNPIQMIIASSLISFQSSIVLSLQIQLEICQTWNDLILILFLNPSMWKCTDPDCFENLWLFLTIGSCLNGFWMESCRWKALSVFSSKDNLFHFSLLVRVTTNWDNFRCLLFILAFKTNKMSFN